MLRKAGTDGYMDSQYVSQSLLDDSSFLFQTQLTFGTIFLSVTDIILHFSLFSLKKHFDSFP